MGKNKSNLEKKLEEKEDCEFRKESIYCICKEKCYFKNESIIYHNGDETSYSCSYKRCKESVK